MTCGHRDKAYPSDSPFANLSHDEVRALAKTSLTEYIYLNIDIFIYVYILHIIYSIYICTYVYIKWRCELRTTASRVRLRVQFFPQNKIAARWCRCCCCHAIVPPQRSVVSSIQHGVFSMSPLQFPPNDSMGSRP
jgi:hypothetical protein